MTGRAAMLSRSAACNATFPTTKAIGASTVCHDRSVCARRRAASPVGVGPSAMAMRRTGAGGVGRRSQTPSAASIRAPAALIVVVRSSLSDVRPPSRSTSTTSTPAWDSAVAIITPVRPPPTTATSCAPSYIVATMTAGEMPVDHLLRQPGQVRPVEKIGVASGGPASDHVAFAVADHHRFRQVDIPFTG